MITKSDAASLQAHYEIALDMLASRHREQTMMRKGSADEEDREGEGGEADGSEGSDSSASSDTASVPSTVPLPRIRLNLQSIPSALDHDMMGNDQYPKLRAAKHLIHVLGRGSWGAVLNSATGQEWQLFIMNKADIANSLAATPVQAHTPHGHPVSTTVAFSLHPIEIYSHYLAKKCPVSISVQGRRIVLK
jgi:hypothetical protein